MRIKDFNGRLEKWIKAELGGIHDFDIIGDFWYANK